MINKINLTEIMIWFCYLNWKLESVNKNNLPGQIVLPLESPLVFPKLEIAKWADGGICSIIDVKLEGGKTRVKNSRREVI